MVGRGERRIREGTKIVGKEDLRRHEEDTLLLPRTQGRENARLLTKNEYDLPEGKGNGNRASLSFRLTRLSFFLHPAPSWRCHWFS